VFMMPPFGGFILPDCGGADTPVLALEFAPRRRPAGRGLRDR
jgi:hypothetical protein